MRQPFVAGNWKMNGSRVGIEELVSGIKNGLGSVGATEVVVCPPFVYLTEVAAMLAGTAVAWGGQNVSEQSQGAFTGEISADMLADLGCKYVIVGHSERRALYGDTDALVAEKFSAAQQEGVIPILCVGETLEQREQDATKSVVARQLDAVIERAGAESLANAVVAYEPVWAIGTGRTATPEQAQEVHAFIRGRIQGHDAAIAGDIRILYGGSVKGSNAAELFGMEDIDGGLIGGASLKADEFLAICAAPA